MEILSSKLHENKIKQDDVATISLEILSVIREVLCFYQFNNKSRRDDHSEDYRIARLAKICLNGSEGAHTAQVVCQRFIKAVTSSEYHQLNNYPLFVKALAQLQPKIFLDEFLGCGQLLAEEINLYKLKSIFSNRFRHDENSLDKIPDGVLLDWCAVNPEQRYPLVASLVTFFSTAKEGEQIKWRPVVYAILEQAPNVEDILKHLGDVIRPMAWSGSRAELLRKRSVLLQEFYTHPNERVRNWAKSQYANLQKEVEYARKSEQEREEQSRRQNERFE